MKHAPPTKEIGVQIARAFKETLLRNGVPVLEVRLFGSLVRGNIHEWSDIDIAVIHQPFSRSIMQERRTIRRLHEERRFPVDILCFRPEDLENKLLGTAQEIKRYGVSV